jgi:hypothetical protein
MTDKKVAKALGWNHRVSARTGAGWWQDPEGRDRELRPFTTSLDCIVAEIQARGLKFYLESAPTPKGQPQMYDARVERYAVTYQQGAPLALCAALLKYLEAL